MFFVCPGNVITILTVLSIILPIKRKFLTNRWQQHDDGMFISLCHVLFVWGVYEIMLYDKFLFFSYEKWMCVNHLMMKWSAKFVRFTCRCFQLKDTNYMVMVCQFLFSLCDIFVLSFHMKYIYLFFWNFIFFFHMKLVFVVVFRIQQSSLFFIWKHVYSKSDHVIRHVASVWGAFNRGWGYHLVGIEVWLVQWNIFVLSFIWNLTKFFIWNVIVLSYLG